MFSPEQQRHVFAVIWCLSLLTSGALALYAIGLAVSAIAQMVIG